MFYAMGIENLLKRCAVHTNQTQNYAFLVHEIAQSLFNLWNSEGPFHRVRAGKENIGKIIKKPLTALFILCYLLFPTRERAGYQQNSGVNI